MLYKMKLPDISKEQNNIINELSLNNNVVVDSVAGSGKTTCNLHIAKYFNNINILLLTYNAKLKLETREKTKKLNINNLEVHSYHSLCVKYYDNQCFTDTIINKIIKNKNKPLKQLKFDLIVLDEAQDITSLYYEFICKIYKDNNNANTKICIFGDKKQSIFDFNKADERFIEYASKLFNFNSYNWVICNLSISFRITFEMSLFINKCLLNEDRIISNKITNNKPRYIICDCFGEEFETSRTLNEIKYYFNLGYKPNDIFVLAPSIKSINTPVRKLENKIKREMPDVMVYVPTSDDEKLDKDLLEGKIIFSTFHQTKGLERKVVIIFNFDNSYFEFYKKDADPCICSNELYVAVTRGIDHLTLFHHYKNEYLQFIDKNNIEIYCNFEEYKPLDIKYKQFSYKSINTSITDIIKFLPQNIIDECFNKLDITQIPTYLMRKINIPLKISNEKTIESVSEITGIAIPNMFELKLKNKMNIFKTLLENRFEERVINNNSLIQYQNKKHNINNINLSSLTAEELLYISNCWNTYKNGYLFKIYQITNYDWLNEKNLDECINRLTNLNISNNSLFEYMLETENKMTLLNRKLIGFIDCIDEKNNIVYEFKCVQKLEKEHYLQLAFYMYMYKLKKINDIKENNNKINELYKDPLNNNKINDLYKNQLFDNKNIINLLNLLNIKEKLNAKLINYKNTVINKKTNEYSIGDIIKYKLFNEETGEIIKIYKTTGKIKVKNNNNKSIDIPKNLILSIIKKFDIENNIKNELCKLNDEIINNDKLINEIKQLEILQLNDEINLYNKETKYVLFNILTNEYIDVKCDFEKLEKMVKYLIYSKYINDKTITNEEFIKINDNIYKLYFS